MKMWKDRVNQETTLNNKRLQTMLKWLWLSGLALVLDQVSKIWIVSTLTLYGSIEILPFFNITHVHNPGAAFSFLSDAGGWQRWFFSIMALAVSVGIGIWLSRLKDNEWLLAIALSLILGGALGNLIDRLYYGYVIDFLDVYYQSYHWPAFNIADSAITLGVILMLTDSFKSESKTN